jgi:putative ABC transport system permease protein
MREALVIRTLESMRQDIRYATRSLFRTPTLTVTALLIMALGIGATTAMFSVANAVLFRPLPFADPERLVQIGTVGVLEFKAYREQSQSFEGLLSYGALNKNLYDAAAPERIAVIAAERGLFDLLGVARSSAAHLFRAIRRMWPSSARDSGAAATEERRR